MNRKAEGTVGGEEEKRSGIDRHTQRKKEREREGGVFVPSVREIIISFFRFIISFVRNVVVFKAKMLQQWGFFIRRKLTTTNSLTSVSIVENNETV